MKFSNFSRTEEGHTIIFYNKIPIENVGTIKFFRDDATGKFNTEFRWSFDYVYWSAWEKLTQASISALDTKNRYNFYLEVRYTKCAGTSKVSKFLIDYNEGTAIDCIPCDSEPGKYMPEQLDKKQIEDAKLNATLLNGYPGAYYLDRTHHIGYQPISSISGLQTILNNLSTTGTTLTAENVDASGAGVFDHKDGSIWYFRTIYGGQNVYITVDPFGALIVDASALVSIINVGVGSGQLLKDAHNQIVKLRTIVSETGAITVTTEGDVIKLGFDASVSGETVWSDPDPISATVGGISGGDKITPGTNAINILEKILYEYKPPVVDLKIEPSSGYYEKWNPYINEASIYGIFNNDNFVKVRVSEITLLSSLSGPAGNIIYSDVSSGSFEFSNADFSYWDDVIYTTRFHNNVNGIVMPDYDVSISLKFVEPFIYGVVDDIINTSNITHTIIQGFYHDNQKLITPKQSNEILFERPLGMNKIKFVYAYPDVYGDLISIFDVKNHFDLTQSFESTVINILIGSASIPIPYRVYIKKHWIDISSFKIIFNI